MGHICKRASGDLLVVILAHVSDGLIHSVELVELPEKIVNILLYGSGMEKIEFSYDRESGGRNYKSVN